LIPINETEKHKVYSVTREILTSLFCATQPASNVKTSGSEHNYARPERKVSKAVNLDDEFLEWQEEPSHTQTREDEIETYVKIIFDKIVLSETVDRP